MFPYLVVKKDPLCDLSCRTKYSSQHPLGMTLVNSLYRFSLLWPWNRSNQWIYQLRNCNCTLCWCISKSLTSAIICLSLSRTLWHYTIHTTVNNSFKPVLYALIYLKFSWNLLKLEDIVFQHILHAYHSQKITFSSKMIWEFLSVLSNTKKISFHFVQNTRLWKTEIAEIPQVNS